MHGRRRQLVAGAVRLALVVTALSLWVYIPYRYLARPPRAEGFLGTVYAVLFPLAALLAWWAMVVAWRPDRLAGLSRDAERAGRGDGPSVFRWLLGGYGGTWLAMGVVCVPSLAALAAVSPIQGLFSTVHMTAQHVFLGLVAMTAAWRPAALRALLEGVPLAEVGSEPGSEGGRVTGGAEPAAGKALS